MRTAWESPWVNVVLPRERKNARIYDKKVRLQPKASKFLFANCWNCAEGLGGGG